MSTEPMVPEVALQLLFALLIAFVLVANIVVWLLERWHEGDPWRAVERARGAVTAPHPSTARSPDWRSQSSPTRF